MLLSMIFMNLSHMFCIYLSLTFIYSLLPYILTHSYIDFNLLYLLLWHPLYAYSLYTFTATFNFLQYLNCLPHLTHIPLLHLLFPLIPAELGEIKQSLMF